MPLIILGLLLFLTACSTNIKYDYFPTLTSISIIDRSGLTETISNSDRLLQYENVDFLSDQPYQKVLRVCNRDAQGDIRAFATSYHENGTPKQYLEIVNNRAHGVYREWHPNGVLSLEAFVIGGEADLTEIAQNTWLFNGHSLAWDESGKLIADIPYSDGDLDGISIYYHSNSTVWKKIPWKKGKLHGTQEIFLDSGQVLQITHYINGQKEGHSFRYWRENTPSTQEEYKQGKLLTGYYQDQTGKCVAKIENGNGFKAIFAKNSLSEIQEYRNGEPEGQIKAYDEAGALVRLYHVKDDQKHGEEIEYYLATESSLKEQPKLSINWLDNNIHGSVKTWYPNGVQESHREMSENEKNGFLTAWYKDGSLMLIEKYERNKLIEGQYFIRGEKIPISEIHGGRGYATLFDPEGNFMRKIEYFNSKPIE